jgi:hypothetical protein
MAKKKAARKKKGGGMWFSVLVLLVGIAFLLVDLAVWDFVGISCCTAAFILIGIYMLFVRK